MTHLSRFFGAKSLLQCATLISLTVSVGVIAVSQGQRSKASEEEPIFTDYRGVKLGWLAEDVRKKLGSPADKGEEQDIFSFGEKETAQIVYDKVSHKVVTISVDFYDGATGVITPQQVFGADIESKPDGSKYKMVRYPKAGFWLSYNRTSGDKPTVTVTLQKLQ
jgi:hypothetical protein